MKKALLAAMCFVIVSLVLVNGTFAMPDLDTVFADLTEFFKDAVLGKPVAGGEGTNVHVELISDDKPQNIFPGSAATRVSHVENKGDGEVYFRLVYAIQDDAETWPLLDVQFSTEAGFEQSGWIDISIDDTPYKMKVFTYTEALQAGHSSPDVSITIGMDSSITSGQLARYRSDFLQMQVLAIDPTPFKEMGIETAEEALDLALPLGTLRPF